jgi:hypothetical protein
MLKLSWPYAEILFALARKPFGKQHVSSHKSIEGMLNQALLNACLKYNLVFIRTYIFFFFCIYLNY